MNTKLRFALLAAAAVSCASLSRAELGAVAESPQGGTELAGPAPSSGYVWMGGQWVSESGKWRWVSAHWELPPARGATWVAGHWAPQGGAWAWVNGAWNVGGSAEAPQGPPAPPQGPATGMVQEASPVPSTPSPDADTFYSPDTGYIGAYDGAVEYVPSYGTLWGVNPWYWGYPGIYLGFGWRGGHYGGRGWHHDGRGSPAHGAASPARGYRQGGSYRSDGRGH